MRSFEKSVAENAQNSHTNINFKATDSDRRLIMMLTPCVAVQPEPHKLIVHLRIVGMTGGFIYLRMTMYHENYFKYDCRSCMNT